MRGTKIILGFAHFVASLTLPTAPGAQVERGITPVPPSDDPFYSPPASYENSKPGTILRSRSVPNPLAILNLLPIKVHGAYQLLYRTTDSQGKPQATVTTIIVPENADPSKLLSYQIAEDASWINCAPSYALQSIKNPLNGITANVEIILIIAALKQGWIVNTPDYEGPGAAFSSGIQAGQATLDSIRAALASENITGVSSSAKYQMWGYSGGSIASEWAAELQPSYAPELSFAGVAIGGTIANLTASALAMNKGPATGLIPAAILGLAAAYPNLTYLFDEVLVPSKASAFKQAGTQCIPANIAQFAFQDMFSYSKYALDDLFRFPEVQAVLETTGLMGVHGVPQMPMYVYNGVLDELSPIAGSDAVIKKLCAQGADIKYVRHLLSEHGAEAVTGLGDAFLFLKDRFDGVPLQSGCKIETKLQGIFAPRAVEVLGSIVVDALLAVLGQLG
ncbi:secretory lipase 1 precursor [Akanthomyces lecanii RCEF 1005]|uniref:Secretory lipase 1 n=1 Tax=Akanthomyces lecanii RCEF 1005 TaxID=1081108 RepID=A0A168CQU6_CORDF|nr:secretory lipase 1 precursor [Akanthomyces lecanii RCEF 1005]